MEIPFHSTRRAARRAVYTTACQGGLWLPRRIPSQFRTKPRPWPAQTRPRSHYVPGGLLAQRGAGQGWGIKWLPIE